MLSQAGIIRAGLIFVLIGLGLTALAMREKSEEPTTVQLVALPQSGNGIHPMTSPVATPTAALGRSGLSHATPPDPEQLRDYRQAQAVYDAEAKPGEFVTPPQVSIEH